MLSGDYKLAAWSVLAAAGAYGVFSRAYAAFSRAALDELLDSLKKSPGEDKSPERPARVERERGQTASLARNILSVLYVSLIATAFATSKEPFSLSLIIRPAILWLLAVEITPRVLGTSFAEPIVGFFGRVTWLLLLPFWPFTKLISFAVLLVDRLRGKVEPTDDEDELEDEIRAIIAEGKTEGLLEHEEGDMIESVLSLRDADVAEIMTPRTDMISISIESSLEEAIRIATESGHSRVPVHEETRDNIVGILYVKDVLKHWGKEDVPSLKEVVRKPHFIPESRKVSGLLHELQREIVHIAVVLDEYGGTAGLVTVEDIVEEVVGEITDEYDQDREPEIKDSGEGVLEADGRIHVDEINEKLDAELPEAEDYDTIGGLITSIMGRIPRSGETVNTHDVVLEVLDADARRVKRVKIRRERKSERARAQTEAT